MLDESRQGLSDFITWGLDDETRRSIGDLPRGRGVLGLLISNPEPLRIANLGKHPLSYGFPPGHPRMQSFLGVPILLRGEAWGNLYLTDKKGDLPFDAADEEAAVVLSAWAAIAIENARLHRADARRRQELERSVHALEATSEIARAVGGETDLERVLELIAKRSRALVEARGLAILLERDGQLVVTAIAGELPLDLVGAQIDPAGSIAGRVLATGHAELVDDLSSSLRFAFADLGVRPTAGLFVPLTFRGTSLGVLEAFDRIDGPQFRPEDERVLLGAASSAAIAVATAESIEGDRLRRALHVAEEERKRWARELHDETLQGLGAIRVLLSSARRTGSGTAVLEALDHAVNQIGEEIANLRALITELRPAALDDLGLEPALDALFDRVSTIHGLDVVADVDTGGHLDKELETVVYRVVQESLANVARHARASAVEVMIELAETTLRVRIGDDGQGFDASRDSDGFGLIGIRERVALVRGDLSLESSPAGTTIFITIPVAGRARTSA